VLEITAPKRREIPEITLQGFGVFVYIITIIIYHYYFVNLIYIKSRKT
jgi:hypothetical protein